MAKETYNRLIKIIDDNLDIKAEDDNLSILFDNESNIQLFFPKEEQEILRGKRAKIIDWNDTYIDTKMIDEVLNEYSKLENEMEMIE